MKIVIDLPPVSKERPHFGKGHAYTPENTRVYEEAVKLIASTKVKQPLSGALKMTLIFYMPIPKSWSEKRKEQALRGEIRPTTRPDIDNLEKAICDGLNGVAYIDDRLIVEKHTYEYYGKPRTEIWLQKIALTSND